MDFCQTLAFKQVIGSPTKITHDTSIFVDNILTNNFEKITQSGIIYEKQRIKLKKEKEDDYKVYLAHLKVFDCWVWKGTGQSYVS